MRINTLVLNGNVSLYGPVLRFGYPGQVTDVSHIGGVEDLRAISISPDGYLAGEALSLLGKRQKLADIVPDPENRKIPAWDKVVDTVIKCAPKIRHIAFIGWDITVDEAEKPVVIEYNTMWPGPFVSQMVGGPLFGDRTEEVLAFLQTDANRKKYIPSVYRAR